MSDKACSNLSIKKDAIGPARAVAMLKNPNLETLTEAIDWILRDYTRMHDIKIFEKRNEI